MADGDSIDRALAVPTSPARLVPATGLIDTGTRFGPSVYGPPDTDTLTNQYAAMPSLHAIVAVTMLAATAAVVLRFDLRRPPRRNAPRATTAMTPAAEGATA